MFTADEVLARVETVGDLFAGLHGDPVRLPG